MNLSPDRVAREAVWVADRADRIVPLINETRRRLGAAFETDVGSVTTEQYREAVRAVFADGDSAVNAAAYVAILRDLDVDGDYPGFVVDEVLGRELAATIAGGTPLSLLAQATFHYADITTHSEGGAGVDDLDAALAAGFQTRLPGWAWQADESPFDVTAEAFE
ncbi:hypothetical protein [Halobellus clavatus]|uniref:DUF7984 domain-containing protein n=1 Tax=Halobellus clavatus TaxID=660517 RepID=A0A1H3FDM2_9EURY|nr:hypothetical protein [Halobellus clavatus]SDX88264.1 hypothetical protein SAMN04487946_103285 [Halobellus clavatus]